MMYIVISTYFCLSYYVILWCIGLEIFLKHKLLTSCSQIINFQVALLENQLFYSAWEKYLGIWIRVKKSQLYEGLFVFCCQIKSGFTSNMWNKKELSNIAIEIWLVRLYIKLASKVIL